MKYGHFVGTSILPLKCLKMFCFFASSALHFFIHIILGETRIVLPRQTSANNPRMASIPPCFDGTAFTQRV